MENVFITLCHVLTWIVIFKYQVPYRASLSLHLSSLTEPRFLHVSGLLQSVALSPCIGSLTKPRSLLVSGSLLNLALSMCQVSYRALLSPCIRSLKERRSLPGLQKYLTYCQPTPILPYAASYPRRLQWQVSTSAFVVPCPSFHEPCIPSLFCPNHWGVWHGQSIAFSEL